MLTLAKTSFCGVQVLSVEQLKHEKSIEQVHKSYHMKVAQVSAYFLAQLFCQLMTLFLTLFVYVVGAKD